MKISLKAARVNANITQKESAERLGINRNTISNWEIGKSTPRADQMQELCSLYGVTSDDIFLKRELALREQKECKGVVRSGGK